MSCDSLLPFFLLSSSFFPTRCCATLRLELLAVLRPVYSTAIRRDHHISRISYPLPHNQFSGESRQLLACISSSYLASLVSHSSLSTVLHREAAQHWPATIVPRESDGAIGRPTLFVAGSILHLALHSQSASRVVQQSSTAYLRIDQTSLASPTTGALSASTITQTLLYILPRAPFPSTCPYRRGSRHLSSSRIFFVTPRSSSVHLFPL